MPNNRAQSRLRIYCTERKQCTTKQLAAAAASFMMVSFVQSVFFSFGVLLSATALLLHSHESENVVLFSFQGNESCAHNAALMLLVVERFLRVRRVCVCLFNVRTNLICEQQQQQLQSKMRTNLWPRCTIAPLNICKCNT